MSTFTRIVIAGAFAILGTGYALADSSSSGSGGGGGGGGGGGTSSNFSATYPTAGTASGAEYLTTPPTLANGQMVPFFTDINGNLKVNVVSGGGTGGTSSTFSAAYPGTGTAIGAKNGANMVNLTADGSNNLNINCVVGCAGGTTSNATSAVATSSTNGATVAWLYLFNGTTWDQAQADASKNLKIVVNAALPTGTNSIGQVTANAGTNLNTSALALDTSVNGITNTQNSTTSGEIGPLVQGAVTTAAPTYTTAKTNPISLTTAGAVRTDSSGTTQPVSGTVTSNAGTNLNTSLLALESGGNLATLAGAITSSVEQANTKQINGVTPLMGNGVTGTGSQRVTIASDNTAFSVNANAGTNLNTSLLALESGGNLATLAGSITAAVQQSNEKQINGVAPLMGNGVTGTGSQRVTIASDNTAFSVNAAQSGTWTVQPGNTANTTAWKVDGSAVTQPVSAVSLPLPSGAATSALQTTINTTLGTPMQQTGGSLKTVSGGNMDAAGANATAPTSEYIAGGLYSATPPTMTDGHVSPLLLDVNGNLQISSPSLLAAIASPLTPCSASDCSSANPVGAVLLSGTLPAFAATPTVNLGTIGGASTAALQPSNNAQGAAIASVTGNLGMAEAITASPTFTTATVNPTLANLFGDTRVSNNHLLLAVTPTVTSNGAYVAGNVIGGAMTFSQTISASRIDSISVTSKSVIMYGITAYIFWQNPNSTTWTDKATPTFNVADAVRALVPIQMTPSSGLGGGTVFSPVSGSPLPVDISTTTFFVVLIADGPFTLNSTSTTDFTVRVSETL